MWQHRPSTWVMSSGALTLVWGLALSCRSNISRRFLSGRMRRKDTLFFGVLMVCVWVKCHSSLLHIKENRSSTVPEECDDQLYGWWRTSRSCTFPTSTFFTLFRPATCSAPIACSMSINIAEPLVDVPHRIFHCNKELYHSTFFVTSITGRESCSRGVMCREALQIRT